MKIDEIFMEKAACFGVAGNFTGHLEQAGEAKDFLQVKTLETNAPKALFPTYIPYACLKGENKTAFPNFLNIFPFDYQKIIFPEGEQKLQIEPECALVFEAEWENEKIVNLEPVCFGASNDCSIRKEGAKKISLKKNWGKCSKGFADNLIKLDFFTNTSVINKYRIASFLVRKNKAFAYGEDSAVRDYSYIYEKLTNWIIDKLNNQEDVGPAENVGSYLRDAGYPKRIMVSIGATRYTSFGENNFLQADDEAVVVLYPEDKYSFNDIQNGIENRIVFEEDVSVLRQKIVL